MDSAALACHYWRLGWTVWPLYIRCGLGWEKREIHAARAFIKKMSCLHIKPLTVLSLNIGHSYDNNWSRTGRVPGARTKDQAVFLPARNLLLVVRSFLFLYSKGVRRLALGTLKSNPFEDGNRAYFNGLQKILSESFGERLAIETPFLHSKKKDVIAANKNCPLHLSISCINSKSSIHCGKCNKCAERKKAFRQAGVKDLTPYKN